MPKNAPVSTPIVRVLDDFTYIELTDGKVSFTKQLKRGDEITEQDLKQKILNNPDYSPYVIIAGGE